MTPWGNTPFQLISDFNQGFEHAEQTSSRGVLEEGGGGGATGLLRGNRLPGLVTKQQAVEFPQVLPSLYIIVFAHGTITNNDDQQLCVLIKGLGQLDQINTYQHL